jgi:hypothetical protein
MNDMMRISAIQPQIAATYLPFMQRTEAEMIDYMSAMLLLQCGNTSLMEERRRYWTLHGPSEPETLRVRRRFRWRPAR